MDVASRFHVREDVRHLQQDAKEKAHRRGAPLSLVLLGGKIVGAAKEFGDRRRDDRSRRTLSTSSTKRRSTVRRAASVIAGFAAGSMGNSSANAARRQSRGYFPFSTG